MTTATAQKRGRRYGSDYARAWARGLHFGEVRAKATLNAICNYVDEDGSCWPSIGTLADDTDQSEDSIRRRLVVLEKCGVLVRLPRWRDERGKINYDEIGKRTTDEIRLLFNVTQDEIDDALGRKTEVGEETDDAGDEISPSQQQGLDAVSPGQQQGLSPSQQQGTPSLCSDPHDEPSLDPISPQSPPLSGAGVAEREGEGSISYERFSEAYGEGSTKPQQARALWGSLSEAERDLAVRGARGYRQQRLSTKKSLIDPEKFLRNRDLWSEFATRAPSEQAQRVMVEVDSDVGRAVRTLHSIGGVAAPLSHSFRGQMVFSLPAEPSPAVLALNRAPPLRQWSVVEPMTQEFGAWRGFVETHSGKSARAQQHVVGNREGAPGPDGKPVYLGLLHREGFKVPAPFPPRVDGSWPEVDNREDDADQLSKAG